MNKAKLKRLHSVWFQPYDILGKAKLWRQWKDQWLPEFVGRERRINRPSIQWNYSVWHSNGETYTVFVKNYILDKVSLVAQTVKNLPVVQETWVWSLGLEYPLKKGMATHSSTLIWRIPWTKESGGIQSMGSQRVGHDWATWHTQAGQHLEWT